MSNERIGCSLADAASAPAYMSYLEAASKAPPSLDVVYINTALETKAFAHELVPKITCTSSNVVQTILKAFAQVPDLHVWYGPDSYMGANIVELFQQMTKMTDEEIAEVHPEHNRDSIKSLLPRLHYYQMNSLSSLLKVCHHLPDESNILTPYKAERFKLQTPNGKSIADVGCEPILRMRHFQASKELPKKLVNDILHPRSSRR